MSDVLAGQAMVMPGRSDTPGEGFLARVLRALSGPGRERRDVERGQQGLQVSAPGQIGLRVAEFASARVEDVMVPRAEIAAVDYWVSRAELVRVFVAHGHSRLPVYRGTLDDPAGFVHIKDLLAQFALTGEARARELPGGACIEPMIRRALYVPSSMHLADLLVKMQSTRIHIALVVDEYGGTDGLVTLEDLVEQIVGDIEDEHDHTEAMIEARGTGVWEADARVAIDELEHAIGADLTLADYEDDIDTLGGLTFALAGRVPERGEIISHPCGVDFEIMDADPRRLKRLRIRQNSRADLRATAE